MSKDKVTFEMPDEIEQSKKQESWAVNSNVYTTGGLLADTVLQEKITAVKHTLIDKIKEGIDNGHNCDYICQLSKIYSNLSF